MEGISAARVSVARPRALAARRGPALWLLAALGAVALVCLPGRGLAPTIGWPLPFLARGLARLVIALPVLVAGLGVAPIRLARLAPGAAGTALGLTIAPFLWALVGGVALASGGGFEGAATGALGLALLFLALAAWRLPRASEPVSATPDLDPGHRAAAVLWTLAIALFFVLNPVLLYRWDGWFHSAVTYRLESGGLPPDDPYYAGIPLAYFWAFHLALGTLGAAAGVSPFVAGAAISALAAAAVAWWVGILARRLSGPGAGLPALALAVSGLNPLGWIFWLARALLGRDRGAGALARAWSGGASSTLAAMTPGLPHVSVGFFPDKFLIVTAFGIGYAALLAFAWLVSGEGGAARGRTVVLSALVAATALALHGLVGAAILAAGGFAIAARLVASKGRDGKQPLAVLGGLALAAVALWPYARLCTAAQATPVARLGLHADMLWSWILSGGLLLALAIPTLVGWWRERRSRPAPIGYAALALGLCVSSLCIAMTGRNETKLFNLAALLLAIPAAGGWLAIRGRRARLAVAAAGIALCVPTTLLGLWGFLHERAVGVPATPFPATAESEVYQWLASHSSRHAVVVEPSRDARGEVALDVPVHARRALLWGGPDYARSWGYPRGEVESRLGLVRSLGQGNFSPRHERLIEALAGPRADEFYLLAETGSVPPPPPPWVLQFGNAAWTLYRLGSPAPQVASRQP